jgi:putative Holliday junction resolvase
MKILAIDFGKAKVGLALAEASLASPLLVIKYKSQRELISRILKIVKEEGIEKIVVGVSEGEMGQASINFANSLKKEMDISIETFDETLSTREAQKLSLEAGIKRIKRKTLEDAYAAALILQNYLDSKG